MSSQDVIIRSIIFILIKKKDNNPISLNKCNVNENLYYYDNNGWGGALLNTSVYTEIPVYPLASWVQDKRVREGIRREI